MKTIVRVTFEDDSGTRWTEDFPLGESAFGMDSTAHSRVVDARISPSNTFADRDPEGVGFPHHTRLSRSLARS